MYNFSFKFKIIFIILIVLAVFLWIGFKHEIRAADLIIYAEDLSIGPYQSVDVTWKTSIEATCSIDYGEYSSLSGSTNVEGMITQQGDEVNVNMTYYKAELSNLKAGQDYYFRVNCTTDDFSASSNIYTLSQFDIERDFIVTLEENSIFSQGGVLKALIDWYTNIEAYCNVNFSESSDMSDSTLLSDIDSSEQIEGIYHTILRENLEANTYYYYTIVCTVGSGVYTSETQILNMYEYEELVLSVNENGIQEDLTASMYWNTSKEAECELNYSSDSDLENSTHATGSIIQYATETNDGKYHYYVWLSNLVADMDYYYRVTCVSTADNETVESEIKIMTSQSGIVDPTPDDPTDADIPNDTTDTDDPMTDEIPTVSHNIEIQNVILDHLAGDAIKITWDTTQKTSYNYVYLDDLSTAMGEGYLEKIEYRTNHEVIIKNLEKNHAYRYYALSRLYDGSLVEVQSVYYDFSTTGDSNYTGTEGAEDISLTNDEKESVVLVGKAYLLSNNLLDSILAELQLLRDIVKEQENQIKYLLDLKEGMASLHAAVEVAINNFITYGIDDNTKKLGAGERAAVIYSFKAAFNRLPENEIDMIDTVRIANGRWPNNKSDEAEKRAREQFRKIYKRIANMSESYDDAAITVMAYGLRQKAENRNLDSERNGINIFKGIYGYHPNTTEDWNIMQAITYSGASRGVDSDGDFLTDEREAELGTDASNPDSDGDGYVDGIEVENNYNPLGSGSI